MCLFILLYGFFKDKKNFSLSNLFLLSFLILFLGSAFYLMKMLNVVKVQLFFGNVIFISQLGGCFILSVVHLLSIFIFNKEKTKRDIEDVKKTFEKKDFKQ